MEASPSGDPLEGNQIACCGLKGRDCPAVSICPCYQDAHLSTSPYSNMRGGGTSKLQTSPAVIIALASEQEAEEGQRVPVTVSSKTEAFCCTIEITVAIHCQIETITILRTFYSAKAQHV